MATLVAGPDQPVGKLAVTTLCPELRGPFLFRTLRVATQNGVLTFPGIECQVVKPVATTTYWVRIKQYVDAVVMTIVSIVPRRYKLFVVKHYYCY